MMRISNQVSLALDPVDLALMSIAQGQGCLGSNQVTSLCIYSHAGRECQCETGLTRVKALGQVGKRNINDGDIQRIGRLYLIQS